MCACLLLNSGLSALGDHAGVGVWLGRDTQRMEDGRLEQQGNATLTVRWILGKCVTRMGGGLFLPRILFNGDGINPLGSTSRQLHSSRV